MKRKLDEHNVPVPVSTEKEKGKSHSTRSFQDLALDSRILQAIAKEGFASPTPVQAEAIPLALEGKDIFGGSIEHDGKHKLTIDSSLKNRFWQDSCLSIPHPRSYFAPKCSMSSKAEEKLFTTDLST